MRFAKQKVLFAFVAIFAVSAFVSFFSISSVGAAANRMPNPDDFSPSSNSNHIRLVVSRYNKSAGTLLAAPFSAVKLYSKDQTATVTVHNAGCGDTGGSKNPDYGGVAKTRFRMIATKANGVRKDGGGARSYVKDKGCSDGGSITLTAKSRHEYEDRKGYYVFYIEAQTIGGSRGWNAFNLSSTNTGAIFSYYANDNYKFAMKADNNTGRSTFNLKFAPKCNAANSNERLYYFDADVGQSNQGYDRYIDTVMHIFPAVNGSPFSGGKWRITNSGNQGPLESPRSITFAFLKDHKYQWTWKSIHEDNGIQFALPGDYIDFALDCEPPETPASTGWKLNPSSEPASQEVKFDYTDVPAGPDNSSDAPKPNESSHTYSPGMDCSVYTNSTNRSRCEERNKYHARKNAVNKNIEAAKKALEPVIFRHYLKNVAPPDSRDLRHVIAPRNTSNKLGCSTNDTLRTYCARVQYRAKGAAGSWQSDWWFRAPNERESSGSTMTNAFSANINKNQKKRALYSGGGWNQTIKSIVNADEGPIYTLLNRSGGPRKGDQVCERLAVRKNISWGNNSSRDNSSEACVVLADQTTGSDRYYDITPDIFGSGVVEQGRNIGAIGTFRIPGQDEDGEPYTESSNTKWQISHFTLGENESLGELDEQQDIDEDLDGCTYIRAQDLGNDCSFISGQENFPVNHNNNDSTPKLAPSLSTANLPIGSQVCFMASVSTPTESNTPVWRHSAAKCFTVIKKPKVRFYNGDIRAGRDFLSTNAQGATTCSASLATSKIKTAQSINDQSTSRVEYGAFATGKISGFGSANSGYPATPNTDAAFGQLTFGNANATGNIRKDSFGGFNFPLSCFGDKDYFYYAENSDHSSISGDAINAGQQKGVYVKEGPSSASEEDGASGAFEITGGTVTKNPVIIYAKKNGAGAGGDIKITGNITYPDTIADGNIANLPKLIILADGDITITDNVTRVDAWIITKGTLATCDAPSELTKEDCKNALQINGPIMANKIGLYRTFGSDLTQVVSRYSPAEVFNLRPDQILNTYAPKTSGGSGIDWQTVFEKSLPPRY